MSDYTGKEIYVGIDVHKISYTVVAICDDELMKKVKMEASPEGLISHLKSHYEGASINTVYEAGFSGFDLHRRLIKAGINNRVVHAASIEISARDKVKTDKRDALKMAVQLSDGRLKGIYVPSESQENRRLLSRSRERFVKERARLSCRIKSLLHQYGLMKYDDSFRVCKSWLSTFIKDEWSNELKSVFTRYKSSWLELCKHIETLEKELAEQAVVDERLEKVYRSAPGVGEVSARVLANELGDLSQFENEKQLYSYTGMTPCEYSSGENRRLGHISRQGRSVLRKTLVQCAWIAITKDKNLNEIYEGIKVRAGAKRAIIAVARRLIGRIRSCFKQQVLYQMG